MLTAAQYATLKAAILADATLAAAVATGNDTVIASAFNLAAVPAVKAWKPVVTVNELNSAIVWTAFTALTLQQQNTYMAMIAGGWIDATDAQVRQALAQLFGAGSASGLAIIAVAQKVATRFEAALAGAVIGGAVISQVFGQPLSPADVSIALRNF